MIHSLQGGLDKVRGFTLNELRWGWKACERETCSNDIDPNPGWNYPIPFICVNNQRLMSSLVCVDFLSLASENNLVDMGSLPCWEQDENRCGSSIH